jgi:hypothetical protein
VQGTRLYPQDHKKRKEEGKKKERERRLYRPSKLLMYELTLRIKDHSLKIISYQLFLKKLPKSFAA